MHNPFDTALDRKNQTKMKMVSYSGFIAVSKLIPVCGSCSQASESLNKPWAHENDGITCHHTD